MSKYRVSCDGLNVRNSPQDATNTPIGVLCADTIVERVSPHFQPYQGYVEIFAPSADGGTYRGWVRETFLLPVSKTQVSTLRQLIQQKQIDKQDDAARLADECGTLRHTIKQKDAAILTLTQALADVMAWLGPTKRDAFEAWRVKLGKKK